MALRENDIFNKDIKVPSIVQEKADAAFSKIKNDMQCDRNKRKNDMQQERKEERRMEEMEHMNVRENSVVNGRNEQSRGLGRKLKRYMKPAVAAAACAAVIVASAAASGIIKDRNFGTSREPSGSSQGMEEKNNVFAALSDFSIQAYAADMKMADADKEDPVFLDIGLGDGGYTGMLFRVEGEGISDVSLSLNKGELYSASIENTTEAAIQDWIAEGAPDEAYGAGTHTVIETHPSDETGQSSASKAESKLNNKVTLYHCKKEGIQISEKYDSGRYYGFYIPDSITSHTDPKKDLAEEALDMLHVFDGSVLSVVITYSDGSSSSRQYDLSVKKLVMDENGTITQKEWTAGTEGAFVYGIAAEEKIK